MEKKRLCCNAKEKRGDWKEGGAAEMGDSKKKGVYRVRNWRAYNESLHQRGSIKLWLMAIVLSPGEGAIPAQVTTNQRFSGKYLFTDGPGKSGASRL
jgi:hypothetical protein